MPEERRLFNALHIQSVFYVVGLILVFVSFSMLLPLAAAYYFGETESIKGFGMSFAACLGTGLLLYFPTKPAFSEHSLRHREACVIVTFSWIAIAAFGCLPYLFTPAFNEGWIINITNAYFEAMSGFTTTGASILNNIEGMPKSVLLWRSEGQWLGGMGIILLSIAILPFLGVGGMQLFKAEVPGISVDKLTPRISDTAKSLWMIYIFLSLLEFFLLVLGKMSAYDALCHTFSTLSTGGFSPKNISVEHYNSVYIEMVITLFMLLGGINFVLIYKAFQRRFKAIFTEIEFRTYISVIAICLGLISMDLIWHQAYTIGDALRYSLFQIVSIITTTGFSSFNWEQWPIFSQTLLVFLMVLGGMAGSTAGGAKLIRVIILCKYAYRELRMIVHPRAVISLKLGGNILPKEAIRSVLAFFVILFFMICFSTLALTAMGVNFQEALTAAITACGNVGPGLGTVGPGHNFYEIPVLGKWILVACMLLGRLEIFTAFVILMPDFWKK